MLVAMESDASKFSVAITAMFAISLRTCATAMAGVASMFSSMKCVRYAIASAWSLSGMMRQTSATTASVNGSTTMTATTLKTVWNTASCVCGIPGNAS